MEDKIDTMPSEKNYTVNRGDVWDSVKVINY